MVWCSHCGKDQPREHDYDKGFVWCVGCGFVHEDTVFASDPTFVKTAGGQSQLAGNFVKDGGQYSTHGHFGGGFSHEYNFMTDSHLKTLEKGKEEIRVIAESLRISGREEAVNVGHRIYKLAVERNFTRGRRTNQVAAACLYIVCRLENKPLLLIDFSDVLQVNVYVLGAVFLRLCKLLRVEKHPKILTPIDPSLFIRRFTDVLVGKTTSREQVNAIENTALQMMVSMKRDWMQTGRKPSGLCGAALYMSALSHGFGCTKAEIVNIVHVCEATLTTRLIEFENTESGDLTAEEFEVKAKELQAEIQSIKVPAINPETTGIKRIIELLCQHKEDKEKEHFAHGLCYSCYKMFVEVSGGIQGGSAPPAFLRAEEMRRKEALPKTKDIGVCEHSEDGESGFQKEFQVGLKGIAKKMKEKEKLFNNTNVEDGEMVADDEETAKGLSYAYTDNHYKSNTEDGDAESQNNDRKTDHMVSCISKTPAGCCFEQDDWTQLQSQTSDKVDDMDKESEDFSDIDDEEVRQYLNNEEEVRLKTIIWTEMNKEYLEELAEKEKVLATAEKAHAAALAAVAEDAPGAVELAAATAAAVAKLKKDKHHKRVDEAKKKVPPKSAAEATHQMLARKKLSSKINYNVLEKLFEDDKTSSTNMSSVTEDIQNDIVIEKKKRPHSFSREDDCSADFNHSKRQAVLAELNQGVVELKEKGTELNMENELENEDFEIEDQDGVDVQPYSLQYEHEDDYDYEEY